MALFCLAIYVNLVIDDILSPLLFSLSIKLKLIKNSEKIKTQEHQNSLSAKFNCLLEI